MVAFVLLQLLLALGIATARKSGGGGGGGGGGKSYGGSSYGGSKNTGYGGGSKSSGTNTAYKPVYQPVRSYGSGYADKSKFAGGGYGGYPNGGYRPSIFPFFFLGSGHRHRHHNQNSDDNDYDDDDLELYFERVENGCQFTSINSYRTIDNENASVFDDTTNTTKITDWMGCTEEWKYNASVVGDPTRTFVSPPIELYACDEYDICSECEDELSGENFNALALETYEYPPDGTFAVDCWIPKNLTLAREEFDCNNDECIYFSEKYEAVSVENMETSESGTSISSVVFLLVIVACIGAAVLFWFRRRDNKKSTAANQPPSNTQATHPVQADKQQPYVASSSFSTKAPASYVQEQKQQPYVASSSSSAKEQIGQVKPYYSASYAQEQNPQSYVAASSLSNDQQKSSQPYLAPTGGQQQFKPYV
jgi:hypothetical protein